MPLETGEIAGPIGADVRAWRAWGAGYVDAHPLWAVALTGSARLWTRGKRLAVVADSLGCGHTL